ncbi:MAG TPA: LacI family DNA-binding transcriptional regulator [Sphingomonas sp.]
MTARDVTVRDMTVLRSPTIHDVARHAGVSHMTVSRVINGDRAVRHNTRASVEASIEALRFSPNLAARALSGAKQARVALLHRFPNPGSLGEFLIRLSQSASRAHAILSFREVTAADLDPAVIDDLIARGVQGVILTPPLGDDVDLVAALRRAGMAIVATGSTHGDFGVQSVGIDDRKAAQEMTAYLLGLGHRRIGFVQGRATHASSKYRLEGYRDALRAGDVPVDAELIVQGNYDYQSGMQAADELLALRMPPTAIFASNDDMAAAAVSVAHRRGIDVPADLSICGFDDTSLATTIWPTLTTVRQPTADLTELAFKLVLHGIARDQPSATPDDVVLKHLIVLRESHGPPPDAHDADLR